LFSSFITTGNSKRADDGKAVERLLQAAERLTGKGMTQLFLIRQTKWCLLTPLLLETIKI
jgi:hypothetical protein